MKKIIGPLSFLFASLSSPVLADESFVPQDFVEMSEEEKRYISDLQRLEKMCNHSVRQSEKDFCRDLMASAPSEVEFNDRVNKCLNDTDTGAVASFFDGAACFFMTIQSIESEMVEKYRASELFDGDQPKPMPMS